MRAGQYAEYRDRVYRAVSLNKPKVRLVLPTSEPCPEGFERNHRGQWTRSVPREETSRLFEVETTATWRGHKVDVLSVEAGTANFTYFGPDLPESPTVYRAQSYEWNGNVPVDELDDVVEVVRDVPV